MLKSIVKLMSGSGIGQLIQFLSIPILTNFYKPEEFSIFAVIVAISSVLTVISSLQLNVAIVTIRSGALYKRVLNAGIYLSLLMIALSTLLGGVLSLIFYNNTIKFEFVICLVVLVFFSSINNIFRGALVSSGKFGSLAKIVIVRSLFIVSLQFILSHVEIYNGLLLGIIFGEISTFIIMASLQLRVCLNKDLISRRRLFDIKVLIKRLKDFMYFGTMQEITSLLALWAPLFFISFLFGEVISGYYSVASRVLWPATVLITGSVSSVLFRHFESLDMVKVRKMIIFSNLFKIIYIPLLFLACYVTPKIFSFILPHEWSNASEISRYVAILCVFFIYALPFRVLFRVQRAQKSLLKIEMLYLIVILLYSSFIYSMSNIDVYTFLNGFVFLNFLLVITIEIVARKGLSTNV